MHRSLSQLMYTLLKLIELDFFLDILYISHILGWNLLLSRNMLYYNFFLSIDYKYILQKTMILEIVRLL